MSWKAVTLAAMVGAAGLSMNALAQDGGGGRPPRDGQNQPGGGGGRNFDPAAMQQRMLDNIKQQLNSPDDEWKVLEPKITKVMTAQRDAGGGMGGRRGMGGGPGGPGGGPGGGGQEPTTEVGKTARDLRTVLQNESASEADIQAKLTAYRDARKKAQEELAAAREDLKSVLTQRQEAVLVVNGMLE